MSNIDVSFSTIHLDTYPIYKQVSDAAVQAADCTSISDANFCYPALSSSAKILWLSLGAKSGLYCGCVGPMSPDSDRLNTSGQNIALTECILHTRPCDE